MLTPQTRECITSHPSCSEIVKIIKVYPLTEASSFEAMPGSGGSIEFRSGMKGDKVLTITAKNNIEHRHW